MTMISPEDKGQYSKAPTATTSSAQDAPVSEETPSYSEATTTAGASSDAGTSAAAPPPPHVSSSAGPAPQQPSYVPPPSHPAFVGQPPPEAYEAAILLVEDHRGASRRALSRFFEAWLYAILIWMVMTLVTGGITEAATSHANGHSYFWWRRLWALFPHAGE